MRFASMTSLGPWPRLRTDVVGEGGAGFLSVQPVGLLKEEDGGQALCLSHPSASAECVRVE